ncbi:ADCK3 family protein [Megaselia abdita]
MPWKDAVGVLRGAQIVLKEVIKENEKSCSRKWKNSSIRELNEKLQQQIKELSSESPTVHIKSIQNCIQETQERSAILVEGGLKFLQSYGPSGISIPTSSFTQGSQMNSDQIPIKVSDGASSDIDISSITLKELEEILSKRKRTPVNLGLSPVKENQLEEKPIIKTTVQVEQVVPEVKAPPPADEPLPELSNVAKQRKVPSSRIGRLASFGNLFAGLGIGTGFELTKGALGLGGSTDLRSALFSPANAERIVDTLCKVRGAALKIGQILSIQDSNVVSPEIVKAFERVRQAADYMPQWQVERVLVAELGSDWREKFEVFHDKPFAAASIGQVHLGKTKSGEKVAIKIQYPGVAKSIESDIDNLVGLLKVWSVFPRGFFIDNVVTVAKRELVWEVDYLREAEYTERFKEMVARFPEYYVPKVMRDLTTKSVLTTEFVPGVPLDKCFELPYEDRHRVAKYAMKLCLLELFDLQCMQTDPNWSNFLYDTRSKKLMLIDFGSTRFYSKTFIENYKEIIKCAANNDRDGVLDLSRKMGFLTGYESKQMDMAHVDAVMILGEMFQRNEEFDFASQSTTGRIAKLVPTMVEHRLCPPPEEIYSIHRKLSGVFMLCSRLGVKLNCRPLYEEIVLNKK